MAIILKSYDENERTVTFGTCEFCMHTGVAHEGEFVFEDTENGEMVFVPNYEWSWGDLWEDLYPLDNIVNFGHFVKEQNIPNFKEFCFKDLYFQYKDEFEPDEEDE